jgi:hypothetical protein
MAAANVKHVATVTKKYADMNNYPIGNNGDYVQDNNHG